MYSQILTHSCDIASLRISINDVEDSCSLLR